MERMMGSKQQATGDKHFQQEVENLLLAIDALGTTGRGVETQQNISAMLKRCLTSDKRPTGVLPAGQLKNIISKTGSSEWVEPTSQLWETHHAKAILAHFYNGKFYLNMGDLYMAEAADREIYSGLTLEQAITILSNLRKQCYHAFAHVCRGVLQYQAGEEEGRFCIYSMNKTKAKHITNDERACLLPTSPFWQQPILNEVAQHIVPYKNNPHNSHTYYRLYECMDDASAEKILQVHDKNLEELKKHIHDTEAAIEHQMYRLKRLQEEYKKACEDLMPDIEAQISRLRTERFELESRLPIAKPTQHNDERN